jgi:hypothetical protein
MGTSARSTAVTRSRSRHGRLVAATVCAAADSIALLAIAWLFENPFYLLTALVVYAASGLPVQGGIVAVVVAASALFAIPYLTLLAVRSLIPEARSLYPFAMAVATGSAGLLALYLGGYRMLSATAQPREAAVVFLLPWCGSALGTLWNIGEPEGPPVARSVPPRRTP